MSFEFLRRVNMLRVRVTSRHFTFVSPFSLAECIARLESISERHPDSLYPARKVRVRLTEIDDNTYSFIVDRDAGQNLFVEVAGSLTGQASNSTSVVGHGEVQGVTFWFEIIIAIIFPILLGIFGLAAITYLAILTIKGRNRLIEVVCEALAY